MDSTVISITLDGLSPIMFDRFIDHSKEKRPVEQKFYLAKGNKVVLPAMNIDAFMFGENPMGCAKTFEGKGSKEYLRIGQSHVFVSPTEIPFTDNKGKQLVFDDFDGERFWVHNYGAPRSKSGSLSIKQEMKPRPVINPPWELSFEITLIKNPRIDSQKLKNWFINGGIMLALGTWRPKFGRFGVKVWDEKKQ